MPTYEYRCSSCDHQFERFQRMSDEPVKECEVCGQPVKRLLFPVAIHFKGSGFYTTDYAKRKSLTAAGTNANNGSASSESGADSGSSSSESSVASSSNDSSGDSSKAKTADAAKPPVAASGKTAQKD